MLPLQTVSKSKVSSFYSSYCHSRVEFVCTKQNLIIRNWSNEWQFCWTARFPFLDRHISRASNPNFETCKIPSLLIVCWAWFIVLLSSLNLPNWFSIHRHNTYVYIDAYQCDKSPVLTHALFWKWIFPYWLDLLPRSWINICKLQTEILRSQTIIQIIPSTNWTKQLDYTASRFNCEETMNGGAVPISSAGWLVVLSEGKGAGGGSPRAIALTPSRVKDVSQ